MCWCEFDRGCEVLDHDNPFQIIISTNKRIIGKWNSHDFINNRLYSSIKKHNLLGVGSLGELIINNC